MIKYLVIDIDGTLTDGKINISENGEIFKSFSVKDGYAINFILKPNNIKPIVITSRKSKIVDIRCNEIGIEDIYQGYINKYEKLIDILGKDELKYCAYFGDDVLDLECMKPIIESGGVAGCPNDAIEAVKSAVNYVSENKAGDGAFREFTEWLVGNNNSFFDLYNRIDDAILYIKKLSITEKDTGRHDVDDNFFYLIQSYSTKDRKECKFESHNKYIDIQYIVNGYEKMEVAEKNTTNIISVYDKFNDVQYHSLKNNTQVNIHHLYPNSLITLFPNNVHCGGISISDSCKVLKIVGKVKI